MEDLKTSNIILQQIDGNEVLRLFKEISATLDSLPKPPPTLVLMNRAETAQLLGVSLPTIYNWTKKGILTAHHLGNRVYYKKHEVIQAMTATQPPKQN